MTEAPFLARMRPLQEERVREARVRRSAAALEALAGKRPAPKTSPQPCGGRPAVRCA